MTGCKVVQGPPALPAPTHALVVPTYEGQNVLFTEAARLVLDLDAGVLTGVFEREGAAPHYDVARTDEFTCVEWKDPNTGRTIRRTTNILKLRPAEAREARQRAADLAERLRGRPGNANLAKPRCSNAEGPRADLYAPARAYPTDAELKLWNGPPIKQQVFPRIGPSVPATAEKPKNWNISVGTAGATKPLEGNSAQAYEVAQDVLGRWLSSMDQHVDTTCSALLEQERLSRELAEKAQEVARARATVGMKALGLQADMLKKVCPAVSGGAYLGGNEFSSLRNGYLIEYVDSFHQRDPQSATAVDLDRGQVVTSRVPRLDGFPLIWFSEDPEVGVSCRVLGSNQRVAVEIVTRASLDTSTLESLKAATRQAKLALEAHSAPGGCDRDIIHPRPLERLLVDGQVFNLSCSDATRSSLKQFWDALVKSQAYGRVSKLPQK